MIATGADRASLLTVRQATAGDRDALTEMFDRCTAQTRYRRFHGAVGTFPRRYLTEALSRSPVHHALVASPGHAPDTVIALASCRVVDEGMAELGVLVEDAWQRHGVGTALLDELVAHARALGLRALTAQLLTDQAWTGGLLARYGSCQPGPASRGVVTVTLRLAPGEAPAVPHSYLSCRPEATRSASA